MAVVRAALRERLRIGFIGAGTEEPRLLSVPGDALAPQIAEMGREGGAARAVADDTRLHDGAARARGDEAVGLHRGALAAAEARAMAGADRPLAGDGAAGALGGGERLGDEGPCPLRTGRADAARADAEVVLGAHGRGPAHRAKRRNSLYKCRSRR